MILRDYQSTALDSLWDWFGRHQDGNPIIDACVGAGKSLMIAALAQRAASEAEGTRILVLVHQRELLAQNVDKINRIWPGASVGVYSAGAGRKELGRQVTFATIGSIYQDAHKLGRIDIVLADECHLINPKDAGMWRQFLRDLAQYCPHARTIGWTGTPFRGNGVYLTDGKEALFTHVATRVSMRELLDQGYLVPLVPATTHARVSTDDVRTSGDDYVVSELAKVTDRDELVQSTCDEIVQLAADRRRWLVFAVTVEHANHVRDALTQRGVRAEVVSGKTPKGMRDSLIREFKAGAIRCLVNVGVLTTGFDVPAVDFIGLLRATKSPVLYVQIAGRGMRCLGADLAQSVENGKPDCMWADFTDTTMRMGPVDAIKGRTAVGGSRGGEAPKKICPHCGSQNPTSTLFCVDCAAKFPEPERVKHGASASGAAVLSDQVSKVETVPVQEVRYRIHHKAGSPDSLRVDYVSGMLTVAKEWVCLSHTGFARLKAEKWWTERATIEQIPASAEAAMEWLGYDLTILRAPAEIQVSTAGKYPSVVGYQWGA